MPGTDRQVRRQQRTCEKDESRGRHRVSMGARITAGKAAQARLRHAGPESITDEGSGTVFQAEGTTCARGQKQENRWPVSRTAAIQSCQSGQWWVAGVAMRVVDEQGHWSLLSQDSVPTAPHWAERNMWTPHPPGLHRAEPSPPPQPLLASVFPLTASPPPRPQLPTPGPT